MTHEFPDLTAEQSAALERFAADHTRHRRDDDGPTWREALGDAWMTCSEPESIKSALRQVRNTYGPTWLHDVYAYGWRATLPAWVAMDGESSEPASLEQARWSADFAPPAIGARVRVRVNGLGPATVTGYFVEAGFLGVIVKLDAAPEWYQRQNGGNVPGHSFGAEIDLIEPAPAPAAPVKPLGDVFVLNTAGARSWVLSLDGYKDAAAAIQAIRWQVRGGESADDYAICSFDDVACRFVANSEETNFQPALYSPDRGPYTAEAWESFCRRVGYTEAEPADIWAAVDALRAAAAIADHPTLGHVRAALARLTNAAEA